MQNALHPQNGRNEERLKRIYSIVVALTVCFQSYTLLFPASVQGWFFFQHGEMTTDALSGLGWNTLEIGLIPNYSYEVDIWETHCKKFSHRVKKYQNIFQENGGKKCGKPGGEVAALEHIKSAHGFYLDNKKEEGDKELGYAIHYIQDAVCPPHVFPFSKGQEMDFEVYVAEKYLLYSDWRSKVITPVPSTPIYSPEDLFAKVIRAANDVNDLPSTYSEDYWYMGDEFIGVSMEKGASLVQGAVLWATSSIPFCATYAGQASPDPQLFIDNYLYNGAREKVGCPVNTVHRWGKGYAQDFDGGDGGKGALMLRNRTKTAYWVHGLIWQKYEDLKGATGFLGYPLTDESEGTPSSITGSRNRYNGFEGGSIEHHATGPRAGLTVFLGHGILNKWDELNYGAGFLGLPISDEEDAAVSPYKTQGSVCKFEGGHIYWHGNNAHYNEAFETHGKIDDLYQSMGGSGSWLGFPISDAKILENGYSRSDFEGGYITTTDGVNSQPYPYSKCPYTLTVKINPAGGGAVNRDPDKESYCLGEQVILNADANPGYIFSAWGGVTSQNGTTATVKIKGNKTVRAKFRKSSESISTPNTPAGQGY